MRRAKLFENEYLIELLLCGMALMLGMLMSGCGGSKADGRQNETIQGRPVKTMVVTSADTDDIRSFPGIVKSARTYLSQADANYHRALFGYLDAVAGLDRAVGEVPER